MIPITKTFFESMNNIMKGVAFFAGVSGVVLGYRYFRE